jgi:hypothetical protein
MGTAAAARRLVGVAVWPFMQPLHERLETFARIALGDGFDPAFAAGFEQEPLTVLRAAAGAAEATVTTGTTGTNGEAHE